MIPELCALLVLWHPRSSGWCMPAVQLLGWLLWVWALLAWLSLANVRRGNP